MARRLTPGQAEIVHTLDRPLFVAAGAGSGKPIESKPPSAVAAEARSVATISKSVPFASAPRRSRGLKARNREA